MLVKALLLYLVSIMGNSVWLLGDSLLNQPIVMGTLTGLVMGDLKAGIIMGATMELAFIGAVSIGAYDPPDMVVGTILGVAFAIQGRIRRFWSGLPTERINMRWKEITGESEGSLYCGRWFFITVCRWFRSHFILDQTRSWRLWISYRNLSRWAWRRLAASYRHWDLRCWHR